MPKLVVLISKRPDVSRQQFIDYYEANHAPLAKRLLPMIGRYTRSFLPEGHGADFDVVTELWFADDAGVCSLPHADGRSRGPGSDPG